MRDRMHIDLEYCSNNGVIAIRPTQTGLLKDMVALTMDGEGRCWVFSDPTQWTNQNGDEMIDHQMRGVVVGSYDEGRDFIDACHRMNLKVQSTGFFVPFSNGKHHPEFGKEESTWSPDEVIRMRIDLPTPSELRVLAKV